MKSIKTFFRDSFTRSSNPEVSIVMPSFNQANFIEKSITSVLEQNVTNLELIVMDGGSTDGTLQVLEKLSVHSNGRLHWYSEVDQGSAHALNKAFTLSRAPVIGWLNSDDLYAPGAVEKAVLFFKKQPDMLMVYGQGQHIDEFGRELNEYPTLPPTTEIESFRDGCFICQPTVFMRCELIDDVGHLNEDLLASFDFDLWLRVFHKHQQRIGFIDEILAYSRLHAGCKTVRLRRNVALEGMKILSEQLGSSPIHWVLSYFDELFEHYPHGDVPVDIVKHCQDTLSEASEYLDEIDTDRLQEIVNSDVRMKVALPDAYINVYADGWVPPNSILRVKASTTKWSRIELICEHASPHSEKIKLSILKPWGDTISLNVRKCGEFKISIDLPPNYNLPSFWSFIIKVDNFFIPSVEEDSTDNRELAFKVKLLELYSS